VYNCIIYIYIIVSWISAWAQNSLINVFKFLLHVAEDSHLLACDTVLLGERFLLFMVSQFLDSLTFEILGEQLIQEHSVAFHKALILN
jgi:hypothetical protein